MRTFMMMYLTMAGAFDMTAMSAALPSFSRLSNNLNSIITQLLSRALEFQHFNIGSATTGSKPYLTLCKKEVVGAVGAAASILSVLELPAKAMRLLDAIKDATSDASKSSLSSKVLLIY
jgi:hypothetical protein